MRRTHFAVTVWSKWVPPRRETTADGTTTVFFGFGFISWQWVPAMKPAVLALALLTTAACTPSPDADVAVSGETTVAPMAAEPAVPWPTTTTTTTVPVAVAPVTTVAPAPVVMESTVVRVPITAPWDALAQCESNGEWDYGPHSTWGSRIYEGGLQFAPSTWDAYKPAGFPEAAYQATREQQIVVAERVLAAQGWGAWPSCSRKLGLR